VSSGSATQPIVLPGPVNGKKMMADSATNRWAHGEMIVGGESKAPHRSIAIVSPVSWCPNMRRMSKKSSFVQRCVLTFFAGKQMRRRFPGEGSE
jgi:hypothetical protein